MMGRIVKETNIANMSIGEYKVLLCTFKAFN